MWWNISLSGSHCLTQSRHRVSQMRIASNIMAVQEFDVVGVTELSPNQQGVPDLPSSHGTFSPQMQGENRDTEEGQSKKKKKKKGKKEARVQSLHSRLGVSYACPELFLMQSALSLGARPAIMHLLFKTAAWAEKYLVWLFIRWGRLLLQRSVWLLSILLLSWPLGLWGKGVCHRVTGGGGGWGWLGLSLVSHNNRGCPSPLGQPRLDPPERVTEWMATVTFSQACVLEYGKWEFRRLPAHTHNTPHLW